jgi:hypothetical protein
VEPGSALWSTHAGSLVALHRVGRVLSVFLQSSELGLPHPFSRRRACPPTLWSGGEGTLACGRGVGWGSPNSDEVTYTVVLYIYKYFVSHSLTSLLVGPEVALTAGQAHNHACALLNADLF